MTPEEFRRLGHRIVDWVADYRERVAELPVMSRVAPGDIKAQLPVSPPTEPERFEAILGDLDRVILPGLSHWQHPRFFGYFPSNGELSSVLGDYLSTGLGVLGLSWQSSPALTEVEEVATDWMRQMVGLSPAWSGVIQDTASTSTLVALICARERVNFRLSRFGGPFSPIVFTSKWKRPGDARPSPSALPLFLTRSVRLPFRSPSPSRSPLAGVRLRPLRLRTRGDPFRRG